MNIKTIISLFSLVILSTISTSVFAYKVFFVNATGERISYKFGSPKAEVPEFILEPNQRVSLGSQAKFTFLSIMSMGGWSTGYYPIDINTPYNQAMQQLRQNPTNKDNNLLYIIRSGYTTYYLDPRWETSEEGWEIVGR